ncbi:Hypothetical protein, putative [Bodo saltans]|uniref:Uncharacterized protein n=1 Tax=Bodo saltans TaxID=75058 RepID=A0A0S4JR95_BODSA|nr:Hypothetical protein, putative [Bodo saltans]|eukprot:CUG92717.1 Hypothetical protein, putative [Bodo saltans]
MKVIHDIVVNFLGTHHCQNTKQDKRSRKTKRGRNSEVGYDDAQIESVPSMPRVLYLSTRPSTVPVRNILRSCVERFHVLHSNSSRLSQQPPTSSQESGHHRGGGLIYSQQQHSDDDVPQFSPSVAAAAADGDDELERLAHAATKIFRIDVHQVETTSDIIGALRSVATTSQRQLPVASTAFVPPLLIIVDNLVDIFSHPSVQQPRGAATGPNFIIQDLARSLRNFVDNQQSVHRRSCAVVMLNALMAGGSSGAVSIVNNANAVSSATAESLRRNMNRRAYGGTAWLSVPDVVLICDELNLRRHIDDHVSVGEPAATPEDHEPKPTASVLLKRVLSVTTLRGGRGIGATVILQ